MEAEYLLEGIYVTQDWQIVARASHWTDNDLAFNEATIKNAVRLLDDAALLQTYQRNGTAFTLATLAFEEVGKVALNWWGDQQGPQRIGKSWSFHMRKQAAAGCLLLAEIAKSTIDEHPSRKETGTFNPGPPEEEAKLREELAKLMYSSKPARLLEHIALQAVEKTKHLGLYADEWTAQRGLVAGEFKSSDCSIAIEEARTAIRLARSDDCLRIAGAVYRTGPLQEHLVKAGMEFGKVA